MARLDFISSLSRVTKTLSRSRAGGVFETELHSAAVRASEKYLAERECAPTEVQSKVFAALSSRRSLLVLAPTGTGKTAAVMLPLLAEYALRPRENHGVRGVYVVPVRALASTATAAVRELCGVAAGGAAVTVALRTGDTPSRERARLVRSPPTVLVTTPESLAVMLATDARSVLSEVEDVVLDEVHLLAEAKRGALLSTTLALLDAVRAKGTVRPRRVGLSATVGDPRSLGAWLDRDVQTIEVGSAVRAELTLSTVSLPGAFPPGSWMLLKALPWVARRVVSNTETTLVFVSSRARAEQWCLALRDVLPSRISVGCFHGSLSAEARAEVTEGLSSGALRVVVATSGLEVGVDLKNVGDVIVLGAPPTVSRLLQSAGRARHRPGEAPRATVVPTSGVDIVRAAAVMAVARRDMIEPVRLREGDLDVAVQAVLARCAVGTCDREEIAAVLRASWPLRAITDEELDEVLDFVTTGGEGLRAYGELARVECVEGLYAMTNKRSRRRYLQCVGAIVGEAAVEVVHGARVVGEVSGSFAAGLEVGDRFVLSGRVWRVSGSTKNFVTVRPEVSRKRALPVWAGERAAQSELVGAEVERLWGMLGEIALGGVNERELGERVAGVLGVGAGEGEIVGKMVSVQEKISCVPSGRCFVVEVIEERGRTHVVAHTFAGAMANEVIARAVAVRWRRETGEGAQVACVDESLCVTVTERVMTVGEGLLRRLFCPEGVREVFEEALGALAGGYFREVARVAQLWRPELKRGAVTSGLLHDVLRKHAPGHLLLRAAEYTGWTALGGERAQEVLEAMAVREWSVKRVRVVPPLAIGVVTWAERDRVAPEDGERALGDAARRLYEETLGEMVAETLGRERS